MRRAILVTSLLAGVLAFGSMPAQARVSADINIHIGDRGPTFYSREPRGYVIPSSDIYYVDGGEYDTYRYGDDWYVNQGGSWYCSRRSWRGPFIRVAYERVPRVILQVPGRYHRQSRGYWQGGSNYGRNDGYQGRTRRPVDGNRRYRNGGQHDDRQWNDRDGRAGNHGEWKDGDRDNRGKGHAKKAKPGRGQGQGRDWGDRDR